MTAKMMKSGLAIVFALTMVLGVSGAADAGLTTIGTATYNGTDYNLIWDDDNNGNAIVWLDYSNDGHRTPWSAQNSWAAGLNSELTYNINDGYSVNWVGEWRLSEAVDGDATGGFSQYDGTTIAGFNITTSEIGHLFYEELGNLAAFDTSGNLQLDVSGLRNTGDFENLVESWYWTGTQNLLGDPDKAFYFAMNGGLLTTMGITADAQYGLAVCNVEVSAVPIPGAVWLLGSGLVGLVGLRRKT